MRPRHERTAQFGPIDLPNDGIDCGEIPKIPADSGQGFVVMRDRRLQDVRKGRQTRAAIGACAVWALLGLALAADGVSSAPVWADEPVADRDLEWGETLLGVIETPPARLIPGVPPADHPIEPSQDPDELFASAQERWEAGDKDAAQRLLELFVARAPTHQKAAEARQRLREMYRGLADTANEVARGGPGLAPAANPNGTEGGEPIRLAPRRVGRPAPVTTSIEESFVLEAGDRVFFAPGSAELGARARAVLAAQARWLKRNASLYAVIEGHADDPPLTDAALDALAADRAQTVVRRLIEEGVPAHRLGILPLGRQNPVAECRHPDCAAQNRRAVTVLTTQRLSELPMSDGSSRASP